ncbi:hypothetical protein [Bradyrhizobium sp. AZCC 1721]|uniref:hypothetical protein n=1 Tax=Bradyrhizobium sp. AZCC 1721 TaxID=3117016 RepID=UPI002FEF81C0
MYKAILVAALVAVSTAASHAVFFTYSEWARMPDNLRAVYISGLYDALISFVDNDSGEKVALHYQTCISRAKMQNAQLAENTLAYAKSRPNVQSSGVGGALIGYLIELCGKPPQ